MKKTLLSLALLAPVVSVNAAEPERTETLLVTGTKTPVELKLSIPTANVITSSDIERMQPHDLPSLLGQVAGLDFRDSGGRGSESGLFVRGTVPRQTLVLIDGVRTASITTGATALGSIPLEMIERIEIVKGPSAGLYGADAAGGVIQIFTKQAAKGTSASVYSSLRSFDAEWANEYGATVSAANERFTLVAGVDIENDEGLDRTTDEANGNNDTDAFDEKSAYISLGAKISDNIQSSIKYYRTDNLVEFDNTFGTDTGSEVDNQLEQWTASLAVRLSDKLNIDTRLGRFTEHSETPVFGSNIKTKRISADVQVNFAINEALLWSSGVSHYNDDLETTSNFAEKERFNNAVFTQLQANWGDFGVLANLRHDDNEAYGEHTNGNVAISLDMTDELSLVGSYGTALVAPTFNHLYFPGFNNPDLLPEETESYELSGRYNTGAVSARLSVYRTYADNLIANAPLPVNISSAIIEGIEMEFSVKDDDWDYSANLDYSEARDEINDSYLADRAALSGNINIGRAFEKAYITAYLQGEHGRRDSGERRLGGWVTANIAASYDVCDNLKLTTSVKNIADKDYTLNVAGANNFYRTYGRVVTIGAKYTF